MMAAIAAELAERNRQMYLQELGRGVLGAPSQSEVDHSVDALRYVSSETAPRPNLPRILDMYCDVLIRHVKKRDGFRKSATHPGTEVAAQYLTMAETVRPSRGVSLGETAFPDAEENTHSIRYRLISASIKVGTPKGIVKELWYEER